MLSISFRLHSMKYQAVVERPPHFRGQVHLLRTYRILKLQTNKCRLRLTIAPIIANEATSCLMVIALGSPVPSVTVLERVTTTLLDQLLTGQYRALRTGGKMGPLRRTSTLVSLVRCDMPDVLQPATESGNTRDNLTSPAPPRARRHHTESANLHIPRRNLPINKVIL
jgi:hypothetical protein